MDLKQIADAIEDQGKGLEEFKAKYLARLETIENEVGEFLMKSNRPGAGIPQKKDSPELKAFYQFMRNGREAEELKAMQSGSDPSGGYLLPSLLDTALTKNLRDLSAMRQLATVVNVGGPDLKQVHSVGGTAYTWVGETSGRPETAAPSLKQISVPTKEVYAMPGVTQNLLDDNVFDLENWLLQELTETFSDAEGDAFINGDGVAKPRGLFTYETVSTADATREHGKFQYIPTGGAGAFANSNPADALIKLVYSVKPAYRRNANWLLNSEVLEEVRKFKDGQGNYLWQPSAQTGQPSTLLGYPVYEDENVPAIGANSLSVAFGDFKRSYTITDRSTSLLRDPYTQKPYVMFYAAKRVGGGGGRDTRAVKFLKFAAS